MDINKLKFEAGSSGFFGLNGNYCAYIHADGLHRFFISVSATDESMGEQVRKFLLSRLQPEVGMVLAENERLKAENAEMRKKLHELDRQRDASMQLARTLAEGDEPAPAGCPQCFGFEHLSCVCRSDCQCMPVAQQYQVSILEQNVRDEHEQVHRLQVRLGQVLAERDELKAKIIDWEKAAGDAVYAMRWWAAQEDGIPDKVAPAYILLHFLLGWSVSCSADQSAMMALFANNEKPETAASHQPASPDDLPDPIMPIGGGRFVDLSRVQDIVPGPTQTKLTLVSGAVAHVPAEMHQSIVDAWAAIRRAQVWGKQ